MKLHSYKAWQLGLLACVLSLHVGNITAQPLSIIAGPITNPANAHIYYLLAPTNWIGAWFNAQRAGGRLVNINDAAENTWVFNTFANYDGVARNLWLGLKDSGQEGTWVWDNGDPSSYRNWASGEPDNGGVGGNEDYCVMRGPALAAPGFWSDVAGDVTNAPVVEKTPPLPPVGDAPTISSQPQSWTVPVGADVTIFVSATGTAPLSYQWRHEGTNLPGATSTSLTLTNVQLVDAGTYYVLVSNTVGVAISSNAVLTVITPGTNCVARPAGLVSWWRAEGDPNDSAGTNHGTTPYGIGYVAGLVGQAFDFKFFTNYNYRLVLVPSVPEFEATNSFAVEGWIYARESGSGQIFKLGGIPGTIRLSMDTSLTFKIWSADFQSVDLQAPIETNQWHHIAATFEDTNGTMTLYVDGFARAQTNTAIRPSFGAGQPLPIEIGAERIQFGMIVSQFHGLIDELSLYSRALSSNEVQAIFSAGNGGKCVVSPAILGVASLFCDSGTNTSLRIGGMAGNTYLIQASTNLCDWQVVGSSVADTNGVCEFHDVDSARFPFHYYRVLTQ